MSRRRGRGGVAGSDMGGGGVLCVCTIRDKIMAPQGLVWPCTRSIKRLLQVPRSTLMSIFWGLILHDEHPPTPPPQHTNHSNTYTHTHVRSLNTPWTYLLSCGMDGCDRGCKMLACIPIGILLRNQTSLHESSCSRQTDEVSDLCQVLFLVGASPSVRLSTHTEMC